MKNNKLKLFFLTIPVLLFVASAFSGCREPSKTPPEFPTQWSKIDSPDTVGNKSAPEFPTRLSQIKAPYADGNKYPSEDEWAVFAELGGKSWTDVVELFGRPSSIKVIDSEYVWRYPWYDTVVVFENSGTVIQVWQLAD